MADWAWAQFPSKGKPLRLLPSPRQRGIHRSLQALARFDSWVRLRENQSETLTSKIAHLVEQ